MNDSPVDQQAQALFNRGNTYSQQGDVERALADYTSVIEMNDSPVDQIAKALFNRGVTYGQQGDAEREIGDYSSLIAMSDAPAAQTAKALLYRGVTYGEQDDFDRSLADYSSLIAMNDAPADQIAKALLYRGVTYGEQGDFERLLADYSSLIEMSDAPAELRAEAFYGRGVQNWRDGKFKNSTTDFSDVLAMPSVSSAKKTDAMFALVEPMIATCSEGECITALAEAFEKGDKDVDNYGGAPHDLLWMVLRRSPSEWQSYVAGFAPLFIQHGAAEKLGQGITRSIQHLDEGGFSESQINKWNSIWQKAGKGCDDLEIPLRCLDAAVEVMISDPPTDRPLFRLPLEIRGLIRPLLNQSLGEPDES